MSQNNNHMEMTQAEERLRNGNIPKLFRGYAVPGVVALMFVGLQTVIDGIVLGNFVGANALASVSLTLPCYTFISAMSIVIGVGCQTVVSTSLGKYDRVSAGSAVVTALWFLLIFTLIGSAVLYVFAPQIARVLGADQHLIDGAVDYLRALVPFFPMVVLMFFSDYMVKALGRPVFSMVVMSTTVMLNIVLSVVFVVVMEMGTAGAGLATGIAFAVGALFNFPAVVFRRDMIKLSAGRYDWKLLGRMMYNGSSEGMSEFSAGVSTMMFNLALMKYVGGDGVAAFTAINYLFFIGITLFLGISDGVIPIVSYNYGAGQWIRIRRVIKLGAKINFGIGLGLFLMLTFWGSDIISIFFRSSDSHVLALASRGTSIYAFAFLFNGFNILASAYFTAISDAKISVIISSLRGLVFIALWIIVLPSIFGVEGIWYAVPLSEAMTFIIAFLLLRRSQCLRGFTEW